MSFNTSSSDSALSAAVAFAGIAVAASIVFLSFKVDGGTGVMQPNKFEVPAVEDRDSQEDETEKKGAEKEKEAEVAKSGIPSDPVAEQVRKFDADYDYVKGAQDARITIYEYSDFDCPFCTNVHPTLDKLVADYDGKVNWVYRHFPLSFHEKAEIKAVASECAGAQKGNEGFWKYADALYDRKADDGEKSSLTKLAVAQNLDKAEFEKCLNSDKYLKKVQNDMEEGSLAGVRGTPGNIIFDSKTNKAVMVSGAESLSNFKLLIDAMLTE